jgi:hypothetical protein
VTSRYVAAHRQRCAARIEGAPARRPVPRCQNGRKTRGSDPRILGRFQAELGNEELGQVSGNPKGTIMQLLKDTIC